MLVDDPDWAFGHIAKQVQRYCRDAFDCSIHSYARMAANENSLDGEFDVAVHFWWRTSPALRVMAKTHVVCMYDHYSYRSRESLFKQVLDRSDMLVLGNESLLAELQPYVLPPAYICEDGVDLETFRPRPFEPHTRFTVGWAGRADISLTRDGETDNKGVRLLEEACELADVKLLKLDAAVQRLPHKEMWRFYGRIDAYACASECEGTPNTVLEAMACGRPVITTPVGITNRLVHHGIDGYFTDRTVQQMANAIRMLKRADVHAMGESARQSALLHGWNLKTAAWRLCLTHAVALNGRRPYRPF